MKQPIYVYTTYQCRLISDDCIATVFMIQSEEVKGFIDPSVGEKYPRFLTI